MLAQINKRKTNSFIKALAFFSALIISTLSSSVAAAGVGQSATFAVGCPKSGIASVDSQGNVGCSDPGTPTILATGTDAAKNYSTQTVVVVTCSTSSFAKNYKVGDSLTKFACKQGKPSAKTITQASQGSTGAQVCSGLQNQALCPYCSQDNADANACVSPANDSAVTCNGNRCDLVAKYVNPAIDVFSVVFGLLAVISFIIGGINFTTSEGDPQKASKAKQRIFNTVFAIVAYMFLYAFLQFLVPGGLFNR